MSELFNIETALRAGALSGTVIFVLILLARKIKICSINYLILIGSVFTGKKDSGTEMIGFMTHLVACTIFAIVYAVVFSLLQSSGWFPGTILASKILSGLDVMGKGRTPARDKAPERPVVRRDFP